MKQLLLMFAIVSLASGCYNTTAHSDIEQLIEDGYTLTWTKQKGEYWDEFTATNGTKSESVVVNRGEVERSPTLKSGDPNSVVLKEDGKLHVSGIE